MAKYKLDNYVNVQRPTEDYSTGDLVVTNRTVESFWGSIEEMKSPALESDVDVFTQGRLVGLRTIKIIARYYDTLNVDVGNELTFDDLDGTYNVVDKFDVEWKHYVCILAQRSA